ncbi:MAG: sulfatase-like hydrolase/transferase, partial [Planctomycetes bacterium]|nr:sulfatase-like hydrolase/transferase [Planctomycetota bacterium]
MDRREFLKSCAAVGAGGGVVLSNRGMKLNIGAKPNVVLVMTDDQGYFDLACHGNPDIHTPNIDKLF